MRIPCLLLAFALLHGGATPASASPPGAPMNDRPGTTAAIEDRNLTLRVQFDFAAATRVLQVRYALDNRSSKAIAVLDRGDTMAITKHLLAIGAVGAPLRETQGDGLTLSQRAVPLPKPTPTVPRIALAARLEAGHALDGAFAVDIDPAIKRVRHCLGVASFEDGLFSMPQRTSLAEVWRASFAVAEHQRLLCTPWFDLDRGTFEAK